MPTLLFTDAAGVERAIPLKTKPIVIGRNNTCDIVLTNPRVSRQHCSVALRDGRWIVTDLESRLGTTLNGRQCASSLALSEGDRITIVDTTIRFATETMTSSEPAMRERVADEDPEDVTASQLHPAELERVPEVECSQPVAEGRLMQAYNSVQGIPIFDLIELERAAGTRTPTPATQGTPNVAPQSLPNVPQGNMFALLRILDTLSRAKDLQTLCDSAVEMAMTAMGAYRGVLALAEGGRSRAITERIGGAWPEKASIRVSRTFVERVMSERSAMVALDAQEDTSLAGSHSVNAIAIRSIACTPLWNDDKIIGYLYLDSTANKGRPFGPGDLDLLIAVGHFTAVQIMRFQP